MPGLFSKPSLGLLLSFEDRITRSPVRSLLTKKIAPPPSRAWLPVIVRAGDQHREVVAVGIDRPARAATRRAGPGRVGAAPDRAVVGERAVVDRPRDADAAQRRAVAAPAAGEGAADDVDRPAAVLRQRAHGGAAEVGAGLVAAVADEGGVHDLEPAAPHEDRAAAAAVVGLTGRVAVDQPEVLDDEPRRRLVVAVVGGPGLLRVAGVLVEDPALSAAAQA